MNFRFFCFLLLFPFIGKGQLDFNANYAVSLNYTQDAHPWYRNYSIGIGKRFDGFLVEPIIGYSSGMYINTGPVYEAGMLYFLLRLVGFPYPIVQAPSGKVGLNIISDNPSKKAGVFVVGSLQLKKSFSGDDTYKYSTDVSTTSIRFKEGNEQSVSVGLGGKFNVYHRFGMRVSLGYEFRRSEVKGIVTDYFYIPWAYPNGVPNQIGNEFDNVQFLHVLQAKASFFFNL